MTEMREAQTVFVVDDNPGMRKAACDFLIASGLAVEAFDSARGFLSTYVPERSGCLVLDIRMPEMSGLELQEHLISSGIFLPIIIVSGNAAVMDVVKTMKLGTFEFIEKPYSPEFLLQRVQEALAQDLRTRQETSRLVQMRKRFLQLTDREKQILSQVISGKQSKLIASELGLSVSTVDNHRANLMKKLRAETSADLTRIAILVNPSLAFPPDK